MSQPSIQKFGAGIDETQIRRAAPLNHWQIEAGGLIAKANSDAALRRDLIADSGAVLARHEIAIPGAQRLRALTPAGENQEIAIIAEGSARLAAAKLESPWKVFVLHNKSNRELALEAWIHPLGGAMVFDIVVPPDKKEENDPVATLPELISESCNLSKWSFLVRDKTNNKVLAESWTITCGNSYNHYLATGMDDNIVCTESHD